VFKNKLKNAITFRIFETAMNKNFRLLGLLYLLSVLVLLTIPTNDTGIDLDFHIFGIRSDHYIHAILFLPFMVFFKLIFKDTPFVIALFLGVFFASFCESLHYFLPYREFSIQDFFANMTGILLGSLSYLILRERY
jgi:glycopeptide antibiotics resistance protein